MANPSLLIIPDRYKAAKLYSQLPESGAGDFVVTRGTTATRVNASGLIESVASGVPRLDYTGGGCPSLLVEPAATNLVLRSEEFDVSPWANRNSPIITANNAIAPDGTMTADSFNVSDNALSGRNQVVALGAGTYTFSCYLKRNASSVVGGTMRLRVIADGSTNQQFITLTNDWVRYSFTFTAAVGVTLAEILNSNINHFDAWGAQLETGSVATSYIPTVASTVTRNADVISLSSVSGLIGQTEGTLYAEAISAPTTATASKVILDIRQDASNRIRFLKSTTGAYQAIGTVGAVDQFNISSATAQTGRFKIALAYANNDIALYVNGVLIGTDTSATIPATSIIGLGQNADGDFQFNDRILAAALYTSRLSNAELAQLTTL